MIELRSIKWEEREQIKEILDGRTYEMGNREDKISEKIWIYLVNDLNYFSKNLCFGLFIDSKLDTFSYVQLWEELPYYTATITVTRNTGFREKLSNGYGKNDTILRNFRQSQMEKLGYFVYYCQDSLDTNWRKIRDNNQCRIYDYVGDNIEYLEPGQISKYSILRKNGIGSNPHPMRTVISRMYLTPEKRNNYIPKIDII